VFTSSFESNECHFFIGSTADSPCASSSEHTTRGRKIISFSVCG